MHNNDIIICPINVYIVDIINKLLDLIIENFCIIFVLINHNNQFYSIQSLE